MFVHSTKHSPVVTQFLMHAFPFITPHFSCPLHFTSIASSPMCLRMYIRLCGHTYILSNRKYCVTSYFQPKHYTPFLALTFVSYDVYTYLCIICLCIYTPVSKFFLAQLRRASCWLCIISTFCNFSLLLSYFYLTWSHYEFMKWPFQ